MRDNLRALVRAVDEGDHDEFIHNILGLPGVAFCRGKRDNFKKYEHLFYMTAKLQRNDSSIETIHAHIFRRRIAPEKMPEYLQRMCARIVGANYSRDGQEVEPGSDEVLFCNAPVTILPRYKKIFDVIIPALGRQNVNIFVKKDPSEII